MNKRSTPGSQQQRPSASYRSSSVDVPRSANRSLVPTNSRNNALERVAKNPIRFHEENGMMVPDGYTARQIRPAARADVVTMARAMNHDFAPKAKAMFQSEIDAAHEAIEKDLYISYRQPGKDFDCYRIGSNGKCFCGHTLSEHVKFTGKVNRLKCQAASCTCDAFAYVPSRPDEVGEFWLTKRPGFDASTWRSKCKCGHPHDRHEPKHKRCKECSCSNFISNFSCAACNNHWEQHETFFERGSEREQQKLPTGEFYMPFSELPDMQQVILTGSDAHMPSPYLDAAPRRPSIQQSGDIRGRAAALQTSNRAAIGYEQQPNPSIRNDRSTNANNRSPVRGPLRGSHRATEE
ncbi:unnamed protein product [Rotaria magnacalcarata]|uniref:Protein FAM221B n=2 Tax=Rotaria magnacalcarata TaxID=392030 RepID=A0A816L2B4_9BILA|nr:unnamed protein product [Rotaria magnacalcarata]